MSETPPFQYVCFHVDLNTLTIGSSVALGHKSNYYAGHNEFCVLAMGQRISPHPYVEEQPLH